MHKVAKAAFDELGVKKLPTAKTLQAVYAELLSEKKKHTEMSEYLHCLYLFILFSQTDKKPLDSDTVSRLKVNFKGGI